MSIYSAALSDCTRKDIRHYFQENLEIFINMQNEIIELMLAKGVYLKPPHKEKDVKQYFSKGRDMTEKVLDGLQEIVEKENIPVSASSDYHIYDVEMAPFSDKIMVFFINTCIGVFCFSMLSQAMTSSLRSDIVSQFTKISDDMKMYYAKGLILTIKKNWLEQPPQAVDRRV